MKKYLISGAMALAFCSMFVGCSDEDEWTSITDAKIQAFDEAFTKIYGQIDPRQDWGFGTANQARVTRGTYPNANMWAEDWVVPPQLTWEQKEIVRQYFQQNTPIGYADPGWSNYFVQQVYKGGTKAKNSGDNNSLTTEIYQSANNGWVTGSNHMDHLEAVFADNTATNKHRDHIFNYNNGTCSTNGNVQNSPGVTYYDPKNDTQHSDEIQLMVNSTTHAFGYFNSDGSLGHTEYTGLVHWSTIRDWANGKSLNGNCLDDGWNRSYMGFDFEQVVGDDIYAKNQVWENGQLVSSTVAYAKYSEATEGPQYIWDGTNVLPINNSSQIVTSQTDIMDKFSSTWGEGETITNNSDGTKTFTAVKWGGMAAWIGGENWSSYSKLVFEIPNQAPAKSNVVIQTAGGNYEFRSNAWGTKIECDLSGKDMTSVTQIAFQMDEDSQGWNNKFTFSRIYLESSTTVQVTGAGEYMMYNNKQVPYLISDQNTYCGDFYEYTNGKDILIQQNYNGQTVTCLNMQKIVNERLSQGYLPVAGSEMKKWVKVHGGADGYYSDWIVTLTEAQAVGKQKGNVVLVTESDGSFTGKMEYWREGSVQSGRIFVEDLAQANRGDIDFNDAVFDAYIYDVTVTKVMKNNEGIEISRETEGTEQYTKIDMLACGGTLPLTVAGTEVHSLFGQSTTTMINTIPENSLLTGYRDHEVKTIEKAPYYSSLGSIPVVVKYSQDVMVLNNYEDLGKVPHMIRVPIGTPWPQERVAVGPEVGSSNTTDCAFPLFAQYVGNASIDPWGNYNQDKVYEWNHTPESVTSTINEKYREENTTYTGKVRSEYTVEVVQAIPTPEGTLVGNASKYPFQTKDGVDKLALTGSDFETAGLSIGKKVRIYGVGYDGQHKDGTGWMLYVNGMLNRYFGNEISDFKTNGYFDIDITANNLSVFTQQNVQIEGWAFNILAITIVQ
jgi:hypothetical protein